MSFFSRIKAKLAPSAPGRRVEWDHYVRCNVVSSDTRVQVNGMPCVNCGKKPPLHKRQRAFWLSYEYQHMRLTHRGPVGWVNKKLGREPPKPEESSLDQERLNNFQRPESNSYAESQNGLHNDLAPLISHREPISQSQMRTGRATFLTSPEREALTEVSPTFGTTLTRQRAGSSPWFVQYVGTQQPVREEPDRTITRTKLGFFDYVHEMYGTNNIGASQGRPRYGDLPKPNSRRCRLDQPPTYSESCPSDDWVADFIRHLDPREGQNAQKDGAKQHSKGKTQLRRFAPRHEAAGEPTLNLHLPTQESSRRDRVNPAKAGDQQKLIDYHMRRAYEMNQAIHACQRRLHVRTSVDEALQIEARLQEMERIRREQEEHLRYPGEYAAYFDPMS